MHVPCVKIANRSAGFFSGQIALLGVIKVRATRTATHTCFIFENGKAGIFIAIIWCSLPLSQQTFDAIKTDHQPGTNWKENERDTHNCNPR